MINRAGKAEKTGGQDKQNKTGKTGQAEQDRQNSTSKTGQAEKDRQIRTAEKYRHNRTGRARQAKQDCIAEQDCQDMTARKGLSGPSCQDRTNRIDMTCTMDMGAYNVDIQCENAAFT